MLMRRTGDSKLIQELNRFIILDMIRKHGPISRSEIAKRNGISPTTVTSAVGELIRDGLVCEDGIGESSGGRKPIMLRFYPDGQFLIGISLTNTAVTIAELNLEANVRHKERFAYDKPLSGDDVIAYLFASLEQFLSRYDDRSKCLGISIIVPGIVDAANGAIRYNSKLNLKNVPLKELVEARFGLKTWLENDANAIALAENSFGRGTHSDNMLYVTVGEGVGMGIIVNGAIFRGHNGGAGEFGHTVVQQTGTRCDCGNIGCLENNVGWPEIYSRILSAHAKGKQTVITELAGGDVTRISPALFRAALQQNDQVCLDIMEEIAATLSIGIVNLVNLFNPSLIILGGEIVRDNPLFVKRVREQVMDKALFILTDGLEIHATALGEEFPMVAAAAVLLQDVFHFSL
ncbi:ROK family transcriptional regulator [Brevibacillus fluminis]|uniref:ROK family transcriptional regulator n=1 Tax=Brevibacillus fluminis TaxID=511487 RepID=UPI003F8B176A